ncbi:MAG TPA: hypothetical protein VM409_01315 [Chloroflexia bacterium]|nr:hypothetical protein [Chloroflexia bacterium]
MSELYAVTGGQDAEMTEATMPVVSPELVYIDMRNERIQDVISRVQRAILMTHPDAEFNCFIGTNPLGIHIEVYAANADLANILQTLDSRVGNLHIAAGVDVCVVPREKRQAQAA